MSAQGARTPSAYSRYLDAHILGWTEESKEPPPERHWFGLQEPLYYLKRSSILGIGLGLFARKRIKKGTIIGTYTGEIITDKREKKRRDPRYIMKRPALKWTNETDEGDVVLERPKIWIDARPSLHHDMRWINHKDEDRCNAHFTRRLKEGDIIVKAVQDIKPHQEIFCDYGYDLESTDECDRWMYKEARACGDPECIMWPCEGNFIAADN